MATAPTTGSANTATVPSPDFICLKAVLAQPESFFDASDPLFKQIWRAELTEAEMKSLYTFARVQLDTSIMAQITAMKKEITKLKARMDQTPSIPLHDDVEDLKGDVCTKVMERWGHEKIVEEMTGRKVGEGGGGRR